MSAFVSSLTILTGALLKVSLQASLLIALVLLVHWLGGKRLSPRVRYALWLLVVARLLLPVSFESGFSVFNFTTAAPAKVFRAVAAASKASAPKAGAPTAPASAAPAPSAPAPIQTPAALPASLNPPLANGLPAGSSTLPPTAHIFPAVAPDSAKTFPWATALALAWFAGVVFLLARIIWIPLRLNAQLARHETPTAPGVFGILEESKRLSGVNQVLPIVQSRAVESPALLGFIRPWLLLPEGLVEKFTPQELRLVFLHELAHLKRRDIAVNWLATLLQILHWPNPLVWLAFARMRSDRELACDELALSFARAEENKSYGHAIIKLLEGFARPTALPGLVGILEDQTQMQRRITMIAQFKKMSGWSAAAASLVLGLGIVTLTDGQTEKPPARARVFDPSSGPAVKILLSGTSFDAHGVLSPDESAIAYSDWPTGPGGDLVVRELRTGATKIVAASSREKNSMEFPWTPVWSPDSRSIAYLWWDNHGSDPSVRVVSREGGEPRVIGKGAEFILFDWSRDGKRLLGSLWGERLWEQKPETLNTPATRLAVLEVESDKFQIVGPAADHARFSPEGKFIVYERTTGGQRNAFVVAADGSNPIRLSPGRSEQSSPIFSGDGRFVLFGSNQRGSWDLWAIPFACGKIAGPSVPIRYDFGDHQKWITSSGKLVFRVEGGVEHAIGGDARDIYEVSAAQSPGGAEDQPRRLSRTGSGRNFLPIWSPDGRMLAYTQPQRTGNYPKLFIQSDGKEQDYDPRMLVIHQLFWSPDGQTIAMQGWCDEPDAERGIYFFSLATHARTAEHISGMKNWKDYTNWLGYSADGKELYHYDRDSGKRSAMNIATKMTRELPVPDEFIRIRGTLRKARPAEKGRPLTWDESSVVYVKAPTGVEQELVVADSDWKDPRVVARAKAPANIGMARLSPDRTRIAFTVRPDETTIPQLHIKAVDGSWERIVDTANKAPGGFSWSGDGSRLALTLDEKLPAEIGVLENFLPPETLAAK